MDLQQTITNVVLSLVFALLGFVLLFIGYRLFDALTPTDLNKRIFEDGNAAAAILPGRSCWAWRSSSPWRSASNLKI